MAFYAKSAVWEPAHKSCPAAQRAHDCYSGAVYKRVEFSSFDAKLMIFRYIWGDGSSLGESLSSLGLICHPYIFRLFHLNILSTKENLRNT